MSFLIIRSCAIMHPPPLGNDSSGVGARRSTRTSGSSDRGARGAVDEVGPLADSGDVRTSRGSGRKRAVVSRSCGMRSNGSGDSTGGGPPGVDGSLGSRSAAAADESLELSPNILRLLNKNRELVVNPSNYRTFRGELSLRIPRSKGNIYVRINQLQR